MNIPPDEHEKYEWHAGTQLATPGIKLLAELEDQSLITAIRHSHIPTRSTDDYGYRDMKGNPVKVKRWAIA